MIRTLFLSCLILRIGTIVSEGHRCGDSGVAFQEKISRSPIVVFATATKIEKVLQTKTERLFKAKLLVECVLKGESVEEEIEVLEAGRKEGRKTCQTLDPVHSYIVFLEKWGPNNNNYRPVDFEEIRVEDSTYDLLKETCDLKSIPPLSSTENKCPNVSIPIYCPHNNIDVTVEAKPTLVYTDSAGKSAYLGNNGTIQPQSNVIMAKSGSATIQVDSNPTNLASSLFKCSITMVIVAIMMVLIFVIFNTN